MISPTNSPTVQEVLHCMLLDIDGEECEPELRFESYKVAIE